MSLALSLVRMIGFAEARRIMPNLYYLILTLGLLAPCVLAGAPLKVFILAGQSNMEGHAKVETFDYLADDSSTAPLLAEMREAGGAPKVCEGAWISYLTGRGDQNGEGFGKLTAGFGSRPDPKVDGGKIGPEFTFGITMDKAFKEPVLIIKTAWGGKSLFHDFRSPISGVYQRTPDDVAKGRFTEEKSGHYYRLMVAHVREVLGEIGRVVPGYDGGGYELAGFVWFQGWNDMVNRAVYPEVKGGNRFANYSVWMANLIRDVRRDLSAPKLPFVIGVMGVGGEDNEKQADFRSAMAAPALLPEFKGNVVAVQTAPFWSEELGRIADKRDEVRQMAYRLRKKMKGTPNADGSMSESAQREYLRQYEAKLISPAEAATWTRGASNAGYHYLGCAKTVALIGRAFAEGLLDMRR
jgi:hypothetical protein